MLKLGIEPKTFALLARRSNQLSYSSTDFIPNHFHLYYISSFSSHLLLLLLFALLLMQHSHHRHKHRHKHRHTAQHSEDQLKNYSASEQQQYQQIQNDDLVDREKFDRAKFLVILSHLLLGYKMIWMTVSSSDYDCVLYRKAKRLVIDFRLSNSSTDFDDLKTHFSMLANGYCVDLKKVSNSLLQGTLQVIFELLQLPLTNRGYVWNEEEVGDRSIFDLFGDCFVADIDSLRASLLEVPANPSSTKMDENEIDLDDLDGEDGDSPTLEMGPAPPPPSALRSSMEEQSDRLIGPTIPDGIDFRSA